MPKFKPIRSKPTSLWQVRDGCLHPYCAETQAFMREKKYTNGDVISATLRKARNPEFFKAAHKMAQVIRDNIDTFAHLEPHAILKRLQLEADVGCETIAIKMGEFGLVQYRIPQSLSFENMDEGEFQTVMRGLCNHVSDTYWPQCSPDQVLQMSASFVEPA